MSGHYKAQIYLITCSHPDYNDLKYIGLDTKCLDSYMSSSTVVKWHINKLGRKYFHKEILEEVSGTMSEICKVEQEYIRDLNAVKDPSFMNMSGGRQIGSAEELLIDLSWNIQPSHHNSKSFINEIIKECSNGIKMFSHRRQLMVRVLSMACYGYLKYQQEGFEYSGYTYYGSSKPEDTQLILTSLAECGILDSGLDLITMTDDFIERLEDNNINYKHFNVESVY